MHRTSLTLFRDIRRPGPRYSRKVDVSLRPITDRNRAAVLALELAPWQRRFVSTVAESMQEADVQAMLRESGKKLEAYNVTNFTDIATLVPSLVAGRAASGSSASIFLRGVGSTALSAGFDQSVSFISPSNVS